MNRARSSLLSLAFLVVTGCADSPEDHLRALQQQATVDCGGFDVGCPSIPASALECMQGALARREVASLRQSFVTDEGDRIYEHLFTDGGAVVRIVDTREDDWGPRDVVEHACDGVELSGPTASGCEYIVATRCAD